jgi:integrase/recombinase XerC
MVRFANIVGMVGWRLEVENVKSERYRDTRGPGVEGFRKLLQSAEGTSRKARRDFALLRLLFDLALRRGEAVALDVAHVDLTAGTVSVLGKGRTERIALSLPQPTRAALSDWLEARGSEPGPLFLNMDRAGKGQRLTGRSVARILARLGAGIGLSVRPHGLRHAAITEALELTHGDVRKVQRFSRHRDVRTVALYDDNRRDIGGEVAQIVAASV